jgi:hypothetical protein
MKNVASSGLEPTMMSSDLGDAASIRHITEIDSFVL